MRDKREELENYGYTLIEQALPSRDVSDYREIVSAIDARYRAIKGKTAHQRLSVDNILREHKRLLDLIDVDGVLSLVIHSLGWNIQVFNTQAVITPSSTAEERLCGTLGWHQDGGRIIDELGGNPCPRVSLRAIYFLTDTLSGGCANLLVVPGSHLTAGLDGLNEEGIPLGAAAICAPSGSALVFDHRLWHTTSPNYSDRSRMIVIIGFSYRWLRPRDEVEIPCNLEELDPVRRQLLGWSTSCYGYSSPSDIDVPLRRRAEGTDCQSRSLDRDRPGFYRKN